MADVVKMTVFFTDGTKVSFRYPRQAGTDAASVVANVKKAIEAEKLVLEVDGDLILVPLRNVKYVHVSPAPQHLPFGVLRGARVAG
jgi:hypothetical protein